MRVGAVEGFAYEFGGEGGLSDELCSEIEHVVGVDGFVACFVWAHVADDYCKIVVWNVVLKSGLDEVYIV